MDRVPITVTALNRYLKAKFESDRNLGDILLKAELSNFRRHARGHLYFTLKDETSQVGAVMFAGAAATLAFAPKDGDKVLVEGYVSVYEPQGDYQVYVRRMTDAGKGDLWLEFERLKNRLEAEGLFAAERKRALPPLPATVGVVTSPTGAAVRDVIQIIGRRWPLTRIIVYPALVQGPEARDSIVAAIRRAETDGYADVLIVGRGGGSIEDLWPFNEERVARAIRACRIPVVSAVGHETDFTIADFAADLRAPTPSGAAERVVPDRLAERERIAILRRKLDGDIERVRRTAAARLEGLLASPAFRTPERLFETTGTKLGTLVDRLTRVRPDRLIGERRVRIENFENRCRTRFAALLAAAGYRYGRAAAGLEAANPLAIMSRGYALVTKRDHLVKSIAAVAAGDGIDVRFTDGVAVCDVVDVRKGD